MQQQVIYCLFIHFTHVTPTYQYNVTFSPVFHCYDVPQRSNLKEEIHFSGDFRNPNAFPRKAFNSKGS